MKRVLGLASAIVVATLVVAGCGGSDESGGTGADTGATESTATTAKEPVQVAFVYGTTRRDGGWTEAWDRSREALQEQLGSAIETTYKENVPEGPQSTPVIESMVRDGADVIVGTSYGYGEQMIEAAKKHPDVHFLQNQWASPGVENFSGFDNAPEDGAYVAGVAMGEVLEPGAEVGWVDAFPIPYDLRTIDGFALGLNRSNPTATVNVVMTNSWSDVNKMGQAARSLASAGAAGMSGALNGPPVGEVAEQRSLPYVGIAIDGTKFAPKTTIVSTLYAWASVIEPAVSSVVDGTWKSQFFYAGMKDDAVQVTEFGGPYDELSDEQKQRIQDAHEEIKSGERAVFQGPIKDADGKVVVAEGETLTAEQLEMLNFVVPNVKGVKIESAG